MAVLHSVSYRTSSGASPLIGITRTRHDALADVRVLLHEIADERKTSGNSGADLPRALQEALDAWLERRLS